MKFKSAQQAYLLHNTSIYFLKLYCIVIFEINHHSIVICLTLTPKQNQSEMNREFVHSTFITTIQ